MIRRSVILFQPPIILPARVMWDRFKDGLHHGDCPYCGRLLDPISNFRGDHEMRPTDLWDKAVSDASRGRGQRPADLLHQTLTFGNERGLLAGRWAPHGPQVVYTAARRTVEGGRSLW